MILLEHYGTKNLSVRDGDPDMDKLIKKAIFPVAGLGTRFLPATKALSKEMFPVVDKPLIQYALEEAREAGIEEYIFVTGRSKSAIEDHFDRSYELERILIENNKSELVEEINNRYSGKHIFVYPDPASKQRKTSAGGRTDLSILKNAGYNVRVRNAGTETSVTGTNIATGIDLTGTQTGVNFIQSDILIINFILSALCLVKLK